MNGRLEQENKISNSINLMLDKMPEYVKDWQYDLYARQFTAKTRKEYLVKIHKFLCYLNDDIKNIKISEINKNNINRYIIFCQSIKNKYGDVVEASYSYINGIYIALNNFCNYLTDVNYIDPIKLSKPIRKNYESKRNKEILTENDFNKILDVAKNNNNVFYRWRDQAILAIFMTTGVRKGGLQAINIEDINFDTHDLTVIDKGHKIHVYRLNDKVMNIINEYLKYRKYYLRDHLDHSALFISIQKVYGHELIARLSEQAITKVVETCTKKALGKTMRPHQLRAGYCSILYEKTGNIEFVRRAVGHSRVETTQRYIKVNENETREKAANLMEDFI